MPARNPKITDEAAHRLKFLGERIRAQRKSLKLPATVAAEAAGMSRITWHRIEKGEPAVTMGAWFNAVTVLGLALDIAEDTATEPDRQGWIPTRIRLADYPELQRLAWHVQGTDELTPREAMDIYERNHRHLNLEDLTPNERQLLDALSLAFGLQEKA